MSKYCACGIKTLNPDMCNHCISAMRELKQKKLSDY